MTLNSFKCAIVIVVFALVVTHDGRLSVEARRNQGNSQRKTPSSSNSGHVTPSYNTQNNGGNSHADVAKLSYPNYNSQPNRPASSNTNNAPIGWNVPQGPPPAYSASNAAGGARTNMHEPPPSYHAPNYGAAPSSNVHQPITATQSHGTQYAAGPPAGATYYPAGSHVPGATYYPSASHVPGSNGGYQPNTYHPGGAPYYPGGGVAAPPAGATYYQAGAALPPGATYYAQPPQQTGSSGPGFGTGLIAGGLGGALLGHVLTPSGGSSSSQPAAPAAPAAGNDRIIIINNGVPVNASDGTTVVNAGAAVAPAAALPVNATQTEAAAPLAPMAPMATMAPATTNISDSAATPAPVPGGIICVPTKVNETDPADSSKMIEVEKIACYPAPPPPPPPASGAGAAGDAAAPLAPMMPINPQTDSQQVQLPPDQAAVRANTSGSQALRYGYSLDMLLLCSALLSGLWLSGFN